MGTDTAKIKWVSDSTQMQADYDKLHAKNAKTEQGMQRLKKEIREVAAAGAHMADGTKKALTDSVTAAEKYQRTMAGLRKELDAGRITEERYIAARRAAQSTFKATDPGALAKQAAAAKAASDAKAASLKLETEALKKATEAEKIKTKADAEAAAIVERNRTAIERYTDRITAAKKALDSGRLSQEQYNREFAQANKELADSKTPNTVAETVKNFVAGVTVVGLLRAGLQAVNAELDLQFDKSKKVAGIQKQYAEKSREMRDNFKEDATISSVEDLDKTVAGISERTGIDPEVVVEAMTAGLGQKGARTNKQVAQTVESAVQYARTDAGKATELTQRALLLSNVSGVSDMKAVMGFMAEASNASAIPSIEKFGSTGARAINDAVRRGASPEQAAEMFGTVNKMMGDVEGMRSATATTQLVEQLSTFVPHAGHEDKKGKFSVPKEQRDAFNAAKTPNQRLAVMQSSPQLRRAFLGKDGATFETAAQASIEGLLAASPEAMRTMAEVQGKVPKLDAAVAPAFDAEVERLNSGKVQQNARIQQSAEAAIKRRGTTDTERGRTGSVDELLFGDNGLFNDPTLDLPGIDSITQGVAKKHFQRRILSGESAENAGRTALEELKTGAATAEGPGDPKLLAAINETLKSIDRNTAQGGKAPAQPLAPGQDPALGGQPR
jgi:hypothetical protein